MAQPISVLMVEDSPADAELVLRQLRRAGFDPSWTRVDNEPDLLDALKPGLELLLSDFVLPQFSGLRALEVLKGSGLDIPFILISGTIGEDTAVAAMKAGASDYLMKDRLARLGPAITRAMTESRLQRERQQADQKIREQVAALLRWQEAMLGREDRVQSLKAEVNALLAQLGQAPRYDNPQSR